MICQHKSEPEECPRCEYARGRAEGEARAVAVVLARCKQSLEDCVALGPCTDGSNPPCPACMEVARIMGSVEGAHLPRSGAPVNKGCGRALMFGGYKCGDKRSYLVAWAEGRLLCYICKRAPEGGKDGSGTQQGGEGAGK